MDRAFSSGASGTPPSAPGSPSTGYPTSGNPGTGTPATKPGAWWYYMVTEELRKLIVDAGLTPDYTNTSQISQAVQAMIAGGAANDYKASVRYTTTGNITLSGLGTQAGGDWPGALTAGDRILSKDQTTGSQNGIYIAAAGAWTRATDADATGELTSGAIVAVEEGTTLADSQWMLTTDGAITIGTTTLTFTRKDGANGLDTTRIDVASAATVDLTANAPSTRHINLTGTTGISAFTVAAGRTYFVRTAGSLTLTNGASLVTQTGGNIVTQAGDTFILRATAANVVEVLSYVPAILNQQTTRSMVELNTANGWGSTNTTIRRFTNVVTNQGSDITYADSATLGATFTINTGGVYAISYNDAFGSQVHFGISVNSSQLTTSVSGITASNRKAMAFTPAANNEGYCGTTMYLAAGSVVRAHTDSAANAASLALTNFTISRVA